MCLTYLFRSNHGLLVRVELMLYVKNLSFIDRLVHSEQTNHIYYVDETTRTVYVIVVAVSRSQTTAIYCLLSGKRSMVISIFRS